jgi:hypothetical protein
MNVPAAELTPKRPYQSPKLLVYGTVREITANSTNDPKRKADGSLFFRTKTG